MKQNGMSPRHEQFFISLTQLPQRMLANYDQDHMAELVLHNLCDEQCFNVSKAAYFVDNPDFNCLQGIAGYDKCDEHPAVNHCWQEPSAFNKHRSQCSFNEKVRTISRPSNKRVTDHHGSLVTDLAAELSLSNPLIYTWSMKHDNHGVLIFEPQANDLLELTQEMLSGMCLLGFCPIL